MVGERIEAVAQDAKAGEGEGDGLGEEDGADGGGEAGEGVADAADYEGREEWDCAMVRGAVGARG